MTTSRLTRFGARFMLSVVVATVFVGGIPTAWGVPIPIEDYASDQEISVPYTLPSESVAGQDSASDETPVETSAPGSEAPDPSTNPDTQEPVTPSETDSSDVTDEGSPSAPESPDLPEATPIVTPDDTVTPTEGTESSSSDPASVDSLDDALGGDEAGITPMAVGADGGAAPYVYWDVRDADTGDLVPGATFQFQYYRTSWPSGWETGTNAGAIPDCTSSPCPTGNTAASLERDSDAGEYLLEHRGTNRNNDNRITAGSRYRVTPVAPPQGYSWVSTSAVDSNSLSWSGSVNNRTLNFGTFRVVRLDTLRFDITVKKGTFRTGTDADDVNSAYTVGVKFGLFSSASATNPTATCEIQAGNLGNCVFTDVALPGDSLTVYIRELDPAPGSDAETHLGSPIQTLTTGTTNAGFTDRDYVLETTLPGSGGAVTVPETTSNNVWSARSGFVANQVHNPQLNMTCSAGVDVAVVLDTSGSVHNARAENTLARATTALVNGLTGTPSSVALFSFDEGTPGRVANHSTPQSVETEAGANTVKLWYSVAGSNGQTANFTAANGTNWDAGLWATAQGSSDHEYDVVFVLTDGNPTYSMPGTTGSGSLTTIRELERAIYSANALKQTGARVITVGVGGNLSNHNLAAISGPNGYSAGDGLNDFDYISASWSELERVMREFAQGLNCESTVTVEKQAQPYGGTYAPADGWKFGLTQTGARTLTPSGEQATGTAPSGQTPVVGQAQWTLGFAEADGTASVVLREIEERDGWNLEEITCNVGGATVDVDAKTATLTGVGIGQNIVCTYKNKEYQVGSLAITKAFDGTVPTGSGNIEFTGDYSCVLPAGSSTVVASGTWSRTGMGAATLTPTLPTGGAAGETQQIPAGANCSATENQPADSKGLPNGSWVWGTPTVSAPVTIAAGKTDTITVTNTTIRNLGSVTWTKVDDAQTVLSGSEWSLQSPGDSGPVVPVIDCTISPCTGLADQDPVVGKFKISNLEWGTYTLIETKAPAGFYPVTEPRTITVGGDEHLNVTFGEIQNTRIVGPVLPLTGGLSRDAFFIGGLSLLVLGMAAGATAQVRRRKEVA